jgi:hypothetical protein
MVTTQLGELPLEIREDRVEGVDGRLLRGMELVQLDCFLGSHDVCCAGGGDESRNCRLCRVFAFSFWLQGDDTL